MTTERIARRRTRKEDRHVLHDDVMHQTQDEYKDVVIVIDGEFEGMVAKMTIETRAQEGFVQRKCRVINDMPYCLKKEKWSAGHQLYINTKDIDLYSNVLQDECFWTIGLESDTISKEDAYLLHKDLLTVYDYDELAHFGELVKTKEAKNTNTSQKEIEIRLMHRYAVLINKYRTREMSCETREWYWKQAVELVEWQSDCLQPYELKFNTVSTMTSDFQLKVTSAKQDKERADRDAMLLRKSTEQCRGLIEGAAFLQSALRHMTDCEKHTEMRLMIPSQNGQFKRVLTVEMRQILENMIGGMQKGADACPSTLASMTNAGIEEFNSMECKGCGADLTHQQCMTCAVDDEIESSMHQPETDEDTETRRKRPRY
jgi:hypothetical protein